MTLRIGIIGLGVMGADHANIIYSKTAHASIKAIYDKNIIRAKKISKLLGDVEIKNSPDEVITSSNIDAILIASPDHTHFELTLKCLKQKKHVLCEKPLSTNIKECMKLIEEEEKIGKRLIQVGFMRRFDPAYLEMKNNFNSKKFGEGLIFHCIHRCFAAPNYFKSVMTLTNALVHEFDISRWLLNTEITELQIIKSKVRKNLSFNDPLIAIMKCKNGVIVDAECTMTSNYGYDVKSELVCDKGTILMTPQRNNELLQSTKHTFKYPKDWRPRFANAYRNQNQSWINSIINNDESNGASSWDGMMATNIALKGVKSLTSGHSISIPLQRTPKLYRN